jgi:hypothetical protein
MPQPSNEERAKRGARRWRATALIVVPAATVALGFFVEAVFALLVGALTLLLLLGQGEGALRAAVGERSRGRALWLIRVFGLVYLALGTGLMWIFLKN